MSTSSLFDALGRPVRSLGTGGATVVGLAAMVGAGVFVVWAPAARTAGVWLPLALVIAWVVACCNASSSARLAARHPEPGGTYVYGRERLGEAWGFLAGWAFVVGKMASCAVMALVFGVYVWPQAPGVAGAVLVVAAAVAVVVGVRLSEWVVRLLLVVVVAVVVAVVVVAWGSGAAHVSNLALQGRWHGLSGVLAAAGMVFFAFAGYARITALGARARDGRVVGRAAVVALGAALVLYGAVGASVMAVLGPRAVGHSVVPLADAVVAAGAGRVVGAVVAVGAALACGAALVSLLSGVVRTVSEMAADGNLPLVVRRLGAGAPRLAVGVVAVVVLGVVAVGDVWTTVGLSSFGVLVYYAVANASALRLGPQEDRPLLAVPVVGLVGCVVLAFCLPLESVLLGVVALGVGACGYGARRWLSG
ncbi:APC family permease [Nocardiopsis ansamitocini]|uniref:APC family permease n=1 Tax=Nocardiopsis ansamitocini TaxID=1670832 RepID=UPI0025570163|nr:amino acid permease [Nocardiopsis ansamitocini]